MTAPTNQNVSVISHKRFGMIFTSLMYLDMNKLSVNKAIHWNYSSQVLEQTLIFFLICFILMYHFFSSILYIEKYLEMNSVKTGKCGISCWKCINVLYLQEA